MKRIGILIGLVASIVFIAGWVYSQDITLGKIIYEVHCIACHGSQGKGDGLSAHALIPKPPDFTDPAVKVYLPKEKIIDVVTNGKSGTQMEGWKDKLTPEQIQSVADYIQSLR